MSIEREYKFEVRKAAQSQHK